MDWKNWKPCSVGFFETRSEIFDDEDVEEAFVAVDVLPERFVDEDDEDDVEVAAISGRMETTKSCCASASHCSHWKALTTCMDSMPPSTMRSCSSTRSKGKE